MDLTFGMPVTSMDGEGVGTLKLVIVDLRTNIVSHLVVASDDRAVDNRAIPVWAVERAAEDEIFLEIQADELGQFPRYRAGRKTAVAATEPATAVHHEPGEFPELFPEDGTLPATPVALPNGMRVNCHEAPAGNLVGLITDDYTGELITLIVALQGEHGKHVAVPMAWSRSLSQGRIRLECSHQDLFSLPEVTPQAEE